MSTRTGQSGLMEIRMARGLSRQRVASELGLSLRHFTRLETGVSPVKRVHLLALAEIYGVPVTDLEEAA